MRRLAVGAAILALGWAAVAAARQTEPPAVSAPEPTATVSGVTVEARKADPLVDRTTEFVRQRLPESRFGQYARFRDPLCVKVVGLPDGFDAFVARRIVEVAHQVGAPVAAAATCQPNVDVIFSARPQAQLDDIAKRRQVLFGFYFPSQSKQVFAFRRPIQSWYLTRAIGTDGRGVLELDDSAPCQSTGMPGAFPCDLKAPPLVGKAGSRLGDDMSSELVHALILADSSKVSGQPIGAVADYVAVLALSRWQGLERCSGLPTVLNLLADGCDPEDRPDAATPGDLALLSGLYAVNPRQTGSLQRAEIASALRKANAADPDKASAR